MTEDPFGSFASPSREFGFPSPSLRQVRLAMTAISLVVFLDGTYDPGRLQSLAGPPPNPFAVHVCNRLVSDTFHPPSGIFNFPHGHYAIGLGKYLALDATFTHTGHCQGQILLLWQNPIPLRLRGYHPLRQHVPEHFSSRNSILYAIAHHISTTLP